MFTKYALTRIRLSPMCFASTFEVFAARTRNGKEMEHTHGIMGKPTKVDCTVNIAALGTKSSPCFNRAAWPLVVILAGTVLLGSVSPAANAAGLALDEVIKIAMQNNKDLQAARYVVDAARARLLQAGLPANPRLELAARSGFLFNNNGEYSISVGFSQQFPVAGRIARQKDVAQVDVDLASAEIKVAERKLAGEVAATFYRLVVLDKQIQERESLIGVDKKLVKLTRNRLKAAEVSELDVSTARIELARLQQERTLLQNQQVTQLALLNQLLGRSAAQPLELDDSLAKAQPLPGLAELQQRALSLRPDLRIESLRLERAHADKELARAQRWEDWTVGVGVEQSRLSITGAPSQDTERALGVTLSIPLPWRNQNQGRIAEAIAAGTQATARMEALTLSISNAVASAYGESERLKAALQEYEHGILPVADRNVSLSQQAYGLGQIPIFSVVQAQRQHTDAHVAYLNTLDQYLQVLVSLRYGVGGSLGDTTLGPSITPDQQTGVTQGQQPATAPGQLTP